MEYNDFKTPDEYSLHKMEQEYTRAKDNVNTLQNTNVTTGNTQVDMANSIDWVKNNNLLRLLIHRAPNACIQSYVRALQNLSQQDNTDISNIYPTQSSVRSNPTLAVSIPATFNTALREYIQTELELLQILINLQFSEENSDNRTAINNILNRRIEALEVLAGLLSGGIFG